MVNQQEHSKFETGKGNTVARIRKGSLIFEVLVDMENALKVQKGESDYLVAEGNFIFTDIKKGNRASNDELSLNFGTANVDEVAKIIVKRGDVLVDLAHRSAEQEQKVKQILDFLARNAIDPQSGRPITLERLKSVLEESKVNIKNVPIENQIGSIVEAMAKIIPIKIETKKIKLIVPAIHTGKVYGVISPYKEKENWLSNGNLEAIINIPAGMVFDFYDKINSLTAGSIMSEELPQ